MRTIGRTSCRVNSKLSSAASTATAAQQITITGRALRNRSKRLFMSMEMRRTSPFSRRRA